MRVAEALPVPRARMAAGSRLARSEIVLAIFALAIAYGVFAQGAFYWAQATFVAGAFLVLLVLTGAGAFRGSAPLLAGFGLLAVGLLVSTVANGTWSIPARLPLVSLILACCVLLVVRTLVTWGLRSDLLELASWFGAAVAAMGIVGVAWHAAALAQEAPPMWRLAGTFTYVNAAASFLVLTLPATLLRCARRPGATSRFLLYLTFAGLLATVSRGGVVAGAVMAAVLLATGQRGLLRHGVRALAGAVVAFAGLVPSIADAQPHPLPALLGFAAGAGLAVASVRVKLPARARRALQGGGVVVVIALAAVPLLTHRDSILASRINFRSEARLTNWSETIHHIAGDPILGSGPGTLELYFPAGAATIRTPFAHNEYLQTLAETGVVGLVSVLAAIALFATTAIRRRPRDDRPHERMVWAAATACCAGFLAQSGVDFTWRFPILIVLAFSWLAIATTRGAEEETR
ncbi:MAG: O-antigen ligase family protein [Actinomycetota bacterium]